MFGAHVSIQEFVQLYWERVESSKAKIPKAMDAAFGDPQGADERQIKALIDWFNAQQSTSLEQELFRQRTRLVDVERTLQSNTTKAATDNKRIATDKIESTRRRHDDLRRTELETATRASFPATTRL